VKVFHLISSAGFFGAESVVLEICKGLAARSIEAAIGVFDNSRNPHTELALRADECGLRAEVFKCGGRADVGALGRIIRFVRANGFDIIHTHGYKSDLYGFLAARVLRKKIVATCHNWIADDLQTRLYYKIQKRFLPSFDGVVAVSGAVRNELLRIKVAEGRITIVPNGIETARFSGARVGLRSELEIGDGRKVIGTVGRLAPEKGFLNLLSAASAVFASEKDAVLLMVGDGPQLGQLKEKAAQLGIGDRVVFAGVRTDMPEVYSTIDVFVLPSLNEGLPMVLLEAMAARRPVIATRVGAIPSVVVDRKDGLLVAPGSVAELGEALRALLEDDVLSRRLAESAYGKVVRDFSSDSMCDRYAGVYADILSSPRPAQAVQP
jgi:glycosyltransferase involved in cell wall biosynthesis